MLHNMPQSSLAVAVAVAKNLAAVQLWVFWLLLVMGVWLV
jgi:hypothetical protein